MAVVLALVALRNLAKDEANRQPINAWLERSPDYTTPLHILESLSADRARALIRAGAALDARARPEAPSPLELARQLLQQPGGANAPGGEAARLVVQAARPWSPQTHALWPAGGRARAVELVRLGWRLSNTDCSPGPFGNEVQSVMDAWRDFVMAHALVRTEFQQS